MATPLIDYIKKYIAQSIDRFDTPGHKAGNGLSETMKAFWQSGGAVDMTLPDETAQWMNGCVRQSENLSAALWGARRTFYCYNGTTAGIQAMLLAAVGENDLIMVAANCHRSVMAGLILCGARPVFVAPRYSTELQLDLNLNSEDVRKVFEANPGIKALILTNPTYFGVGCNLRKIAAIVHEYGAVLLVDEAHGAHWHFSGELPQDALACGADIVVQSTHKMLAGLSQASMLHIGTDRVNERRLADVLKMLQSSSPNYLLLASLDAVQADMAENGRNKIAGAVKLAGQIRNRIAATPLVCYNNILVEKHGGFKTDPCKLIVDFDGYSLQGRSLELLLREHGVIAELCDARLALFHITIGDSAKSADRLVAALTGIFEKCRPVKKDCSGECCVPCPQSNISPREAFYGRKRFCSISEAAGETSAGTVCFYPPGIPVLFPGCVITTEAVAYIQKMEQSGLLAEGSDAPIAQMEILAE